MNQFSGFGGTCLNARAKTETVLVAASSIHLECQTENKNHRGW